MTGSTFARNLVRKSKRAIRSARLDVQDRDFDSAVNRSYYAMFDMARAALLSSGIPEDKLPRTHKDVIAAFRRHVIESGKIDVELAAALSRTEALRLQADYSGTEIDAKSATDAYTRAEMFVQVVEQVFSQVDTSRRSKPEREKPDNDDKVSEPGVGEERTMRSGADVPQFSLEEERRQARENWLRLRQQQVQSAKSVEPRGADRGVGEDRGYSPDDDLNA